jgi:hypothetical protein
VSKTGSNYGIVDNNRLIIVVGSNYQLQLDYYHYKTITPENRQFASVCNSAVTLDESYNRYILGYDKIGDQWGYWKNKDALFLSYKLGPSLFIDKDGVKHFKIFRKNIDFTKTERHLHDVLMLKNYQLSETTFKEIYDDHVMGTIMVLVSVEFL